MYNLLSSRYMRLRTSEGRYEGLAMGRLQREQELQEVIRQAEMAVASSEGDTDQEQARRELDIANKRLELFRLQHDSTGVFKGPLFGRDLHEQLQMSGVERGESGEYDESAAEGTHAILVNMGELDRLNKVSHDFGNQVLSAVASHIHEQTSQVFSEKYGGQQETQGAAAFKIYRVSGNDFQILLKGVDQDVVEQIRERFRQPYDISGLRAGQDPVPLSASRASLKEAVHIMNGLSSSENEQKRLISVLQQQGQIANDVEKIMVRRARLLEKVQENRKLGVEPTDATDPRSARALYDAFLQKSLGNALLSEDERRKQGSALSFEEVVQRLGDEDATKHLALEDALRVFRAQQHAHENDHGVTQRVLEAVAAKAGSGGVKTQHLFTENERLTESSRDEADAIVERGASTRGAQRVKELEQRLAEASDQPNAESIRLDMEIEKARRDTRTGLYDRGVFFGAMEQSFSEGVPQSVISIDLAFLKYYDKNGGTKTGDAAIIRAAEILDRVTGELQQRGIPAEAYRVGGDEFTLTVGSADAQVIRELKQRIQQACQEAGPVPPSSRASGTYRPEVLQMSVGDRSARSLEEFQQEMTAMGLFKAAGETLSDAERGELLNLFVHLADKESEIQKTVNRFLFLMARRSKQVEGGNYPDLLAFSQKAIFGAEGVSKIENWITELGEDVTAETLQKKVPDVLSFVLSKLREQDAKDEAVQSLADRLIESSVRLRFYEEWVKELADEKHVLHHMLKEERLRYKVLREQKLDEVADSQRLLELEKKVHEAG